MDAQASLRPGRLRCPGLARLPRPRDAPTVAPARPGKLRHHRTRADVSLDGRRLRGQERPLRPRNRGDGRAGSGRRCGAFHRRRGHERALGRTDEHRRQTQRRGGVHLRQQHSRLPQNRGDGISSVLCGHSSARQHGTRTRDGLRRAGALRRRAGATAARCWCNRENWSSRTSTAWSSSPARWRTKRSPARTRKSPRKIIRAETCCAATRCAPYSTATACSNSRSIHPTIQRSTNP